MEECQSEEDISDSEFLKNCERYINSNNIAGENETSGNLATTMDKTVEKRKIREDEIIEDDGFITVIRRRPKRLIRSESSEGNNMRVDLEKNKESNYVEKQEVCITSLDVLPKQIALAKILRSQSIVNVDRIKYKGLNKVIITFNNKDDARKLIESDLIKEMGFRCQYTQELSASYGVAKGIDLDLSEDEIQKLLECDIPIISVRRLKRISYEGSWVDSEAVRICFKGCTLPQHVYVYGCRIKVDAYRFPVTQCTTCWQYGHIKKFCTLKKPICPKCGSNEHDNCLIKEYNCLNCKGDHFVLEKSCPFFIREQEIRNIMSTEQLTYRKALQIFIEKKRDTKNVKEISLDTSSCVTTNCVNGKETYSNIVTKALVHQQPDSVEQIVAQPLEEDVGKNKAKPVQGLPNTKNVAGKRSKSTSWEETMEQEQEVRVCQSEEENRTRDKSLWQRFEFKKFWLKIKGIFLSESSFEDKVLSIVKVVCCELKDFVVNNLLTGGLLEQMIRVFNG